MGEFRGVIGRYREESEPWWEPPLEAPEGAPNVLVILLDDTGFAQLGCFGSDIDTPALDRLAADGLRYTNFHTTALCSPTRACVLTGRNHHSNGMGRITDLPGGFPGYTNRIPPENGTLAEMLVPHGYAAYAVGKWHLTPHDEHDLGAPRERWPLGKGFERFYGFLSGETHQFAPSLVNGNDFVGPPGRWEDGYHLTEDLADTAIRYVADLHAARPRKPFFCYFATGACHSPHQAPPEWIERYRGHFDAGWDAWRDATFERQRSMGFFPDTTELSPRPEWVPAWDSLGADERRLYARYMEAFAGFLSHTDHQIGRILDFLDRLGVLDDTLVLACSDNGASSEGGPTGSVNDLRPWNMAERPLEEAIARIDEIGGPRLHNNYPWGWTVAGNTPFRRWKREVHEGGVADPLIVRWPSGMHARGELRDQYVHAIDLVPTILDVIGIEAPEQIKGVRQAPIEGVTFRQTFDDARAPSNRTTQYFEMFGCRAIYDDGWKAVTYHPIADTTARLADDPWELYHVAVDPSECHDLADSEPDRLEQMVELWWQEAERYQVLPLDNNPFDALFLELPHKKARNRFVYYPGTSRVDESVSPNVRNRSHRIVAEVDIPDGGAEGILLAQGSMLGGYALFVRDSRLVYVHSLASLREDRVESDRAVPPGRHTLEMRFDRTGDHRGVARLLVDGEQVGEVEIRRFTPTRFSLTEEGLCCGYDMGLPVCDDYQVPFRFTGRIERVVVETSGEPFVDAAAEADLSIRAQ